jgi:hypothetical protein
VGTESGRNGNMALSHSITCKNVVALTAIICYIVVKRFPKSVYKQTKSQHEPPLLATHPLKQAKGVQDMSNLGFRMHQERERNILQSIADGTENRDWVDQTLKQKGCEFV